jgi:hypothetical protein
MRWLAAALAAASALATAHGSSAAPRFPTGWWESSQAGGYASFELHRINSGRYELRRLQTWRDHCGTGYFEGKDPRILVDRRGRFRPRGRREKSANAAFEIAGVRGRLTGWRRAGARLRLSWNRLSAFPRDEPDAVPVACWPARTFVVRPAKRVRATERARRRGSAELDMERIPPSQAGERRGPGRSIGSDAGVVDPELTMLVRPSVQRMAYCPSVIETPEHAAAAADVEVHPTTTRIRSAPITICRRP